MENKLEIGIVEVETEVVLIRKDLKCQCGEDMVHQMTEKEAYFRMHRYKCKNCGHTHRSPYKYPIFEDSNRG